MTVEDFITSPLGQYMAQKWQWDREDFVFLSGHMQRYRLALEEDLRPNGPRVLELMLEFFVHFGGSEDHFRGSEDAVDAWRHESTTWQREGLASTGDRIPQQCRDALYCANLFPAN